MTLVVAVEPNIVSPLRHSGRNEVVFGCTFYSTVEAVPRVTLDPASEELTAAIRSYESRRLGLGAELYAAVAQTIERIEHFRQSVSRAAGAFRIAAFRRAIPVHDRVSSP